LDNPDLTRQYYNIPQEKNYIAQATPAGYEIDKKCQLMMLKHNLSYIKAFKLVSTDPENAELVRAYLGESNEL